MDRLGYRDLLPAALRNYVILVTVAGPALACTLALLTGSLSSHEARTAAILTLLAGVGERFPLQLTHKTTVNVASAAYLAMVLTLPVELPGVLVLLATTAGLELRRRARPDISPAEILFNVGQTTLYVSLGAVIYGKSVEYSFGPTIAGLGTLGPIVLTAAAMHLLNTGLVAGAAGLQLDVSILRTWTRSIPLDAGPQAALAMIGLLAAIIAQAAWYLVPLLAVPGILVQRAVRETVLLRKRTHEALASLVEVVELRDPYTAGHSRRVAQTARLIAHQLGLTEEEADLVESAGRVHDIGKLAVDPHVLMKTSKLDDDEWTQMQLHPVHGAGVVDRFVSYEEGRAFVRHHHERWDGAGYPDKIAGEAIPLGARILAVADSFDAMTSDRPYRDGMPVERAMAILKEGAGTQWDPQVVAAFVAVVEARPGDVPVFRRAEPVSPAPSKPQSPPATATSVTEAA